MPVSCQHGRSKDVAEVELGGSAIPILSIVELHTLAQFENRSCRALSPALRQSGQNRAVSTIAHKPFVDPVVGEELVRPVRVRVQSANRFEEPSLRAGSDGYRFAAGLDNDFVHRVVELLLAWDVTAETAVQDRGDPLPPKWQ